MKVIKTVEVILNEDEMINICDLYEFALGEGYKVDSKDTEIIKELLKIEYIRGSSSCYPLLYTLFNPNSKKENNKCVRKD